MVTAGLNNTYIFFDASYYVSLANKNDSNHHRSISISKTLENKPHYPFISNFIFLETVTIISQRAGRKKSILFGEYLKNKIEIVKITDLLEQKTWELFKQIKDKDVSFVDCSTLAVLKEKNITQIVTFDHHFEKFSKQFAFSVIA